MVSVVSQPTVNQKIEVDIKGAVGYQKEKDTKEYQFVKRQNDSTFYHHMQEDNIDFFADQTLIPHKDSQFGPVMAKGDLNKDGLNDILNVTVLKEKLTFKTNI